MAYYKEGEDNLTASGRMSWSFVGASCEVMKQLRGTQEATPINTHDSDRQDRQYTRKSGKACVFQTFVAHGCCDHPNSAAAQVSHSVDVQALI